MMQLSISIKKGGGNTETKVVERIVEKIESDEVAMMKADLKNIVEEVAKLKSELGSVKDELATLKNPPKAGLLGRLRRLVST